jgi:hypothetical protein
MALDHDDTQPCIEHGDGDPRAHYGRDPTCLRHALMRSRHRRAGI